MSGSVWPVTCAHCGEVSYKPVGAVNRAARQGAPLYCDRECAGLGRRKHKSLAQRKAEKAEYDRRRRRELGDELLAKKREAYHAAVAADPDSVRAKQREHRRKRKAAHLEYCRRPEYREWKRQYDRRHLAEKHFGPFAEAALVLRDLEQAVLDRASRYDLDLASGKLNKATRRKREYAKAVGC